MRYVILSAPKRKSILESSLYSMRRFGMPEPTVVMGKDFTNEWENEMMSEVTKAHRNQWSIVQKSGEPACIFEDDALFLRACTIPEIADGELFFFGVTQAIFETYVRGGMSILRSMRGTHAYVVNKYSAKLLLRDNHPIVDLHVNELIQWKHLKGIVPTPYACCQSPHKSGLSSDRGSFKSQHGGKVSGRLIPASELLGMNDCQFKPVDENA